MLATWLRLDMAGRALWQLWTLMFVSRGSGYELASHVIRAVWLYVNTLWQAVVANSAKASGPYAALEWLPAETYSQALPG